MICDHPRCTGKHAHGFRKSELCPAAHEKGLACCRRYYARNRTRVINRIRAYFLTPAGIITKVNSRANQRKGAKV